jgi:hypothetical protein
LPWAYGFAYQRVLAFRKTRSRSRLVFNDEVLELISDVYIGDTISADVRLGALKQCLEKLKTTEGGARAVRREAIREDAGVAARP